MKFWFLILLIFTFLTKELVVGLVCIDGNAIALIADSAEDTSENEDLDPNLDENWEQPFNQQTSVNLGLQLSHTARHLLRPFFNLYLEIQSPPPELH